MLGIMNNQPLHNSPSPRRHAETAIATSLEPESRSPAERTAVSRQPSLELLQGRVRARKPVPTTQTIFNLFDLQDENTRTATTPKSVNFSRPSTNAGSQTKERRVSSSKSSGGASADSWPKNDPWSQPTTPGTGATPILPSEAPPTQNDGKPQAAKGREPSIDSGTDTPTNALTTPGGRRIPTPRKSWPFSEGSKPSTPSTISKAADVQRAPSDQSAETVSRKSPAVEHARNRKSLPVPARPGDPSTHAYQPYRKPSSTASSIPKATTEVTTAPADSSSRGPTRTPRPGQDSVTPSGKTSKEETNIQNQETGSGLSETSTESGRRLRRQKTRQTLRDSVRERPQTAEKPPLPMESAPDESGAKSGGGSAVKAITALFEKASHDSITSSAQKAKGEGRDDDTKRKSVASLYATNAPTPSAKSERSRRSSSAKPSRSLAYRQREQAHGEEWAKTTPGTVPRPRSSPGALTSKSFTPRTVLKSKPLTDGTPTRSEKHAVAPPPSCESSISSARQGRGRRMDDDGLEGGRCTGAKVSNESPLRGSTVLHAQIVSLKKELEGRSEQIAHLRRQVETKAVGGSDLGALSEQLQASKKECTTWRARAEAAEKRAAALERRLCSSRPGSGGGGMDENNRWSIYGQTISEGQSNRNRDSKEMRRSVGDRTSELYGQEQLGHGAGIWTAAQAFLG